MTSSLRITEADLVLPTEIAPQGSIEMADGRITGINRPAHRSIDPRELRLPGRLILPGLIDLHSDAVEKLVEPRPKVYFPLPFAVRECDRRHLSAGITTTFNSVAFAGREFGVRDPLIADRIIRALHSEPASQRRRLHVRYEMTDPDSVPLIESLIEEGKVDLISFMDHSPDQGQYAVRGAYTRYLMRTYAMTEREARKLIALKRENLHIHAPENMRRLVAAARAKGIPIASHDLDSSEMVERWHQLGAGISEFPINEVSARSSNKLGMKIVMGAPNVVRGNSSGRALRAIDVVRQGLADVLCSDYMPTTLLPALFRVTQELDLSLPEAVSLATWRPAEAVGLSDHGKLSEGYLADLLVVNPTPAGPQLEGVMVGGQWRYLNCDLTNVGSG